MASSDDGDMAPPSRRSSRKKARVSYDENIVRIHEDEQAEKPKRRRPRRAPPKKRPVASPDDSESEEEAVARKPRPPKKQKTSSSSTGRGPESERTCPFCSRVCSSKTGLKYHIEHFVCRPAMNPAKSSARGKKRTASDSDDFEEIEETSAAKRPSGANKGKRKRGGKKKFPKERGPLAGRTCPHCKRVFTSVLGQEYHVKNKVCTSKKPAKSDANIPFPTLEAGSKFMTPFGIVELVTDNRATPSAVQMPAKSTIEKRQGRTVHQKGSTAVAIKTRLQRARLSRMYESGNVTQRGVWKACFGGDPRRLSAQEKKPVAVASKQAIRLDPEYPEGSYPDRIVECVLIPDERNRVINESDSDDDESMEVDLSESKSGEQGGDSSKKSPYGMKLFLRRRTLTEPYVASHTVYNCEDCGQPFYSKVGYNYHTRADVCVTRAKKVAAANQKFLESVEEKALAALKRTTRPERKKSNKNIAVYPQVWLSLGFKFVVQRGRKKPERIAEKAEEEAQQSEPLDDVLRRLKNELRRDQDRSLGSVYPGVFDSLGFRRPPPEWKIAEKEEKARKRKEALERKRRELSQLANPQKPPPPIVDIQVLADEADSGRYPSIKRFDGESHNAACEICKSQDGTLLPCDFCPKVVHLDCIRQKHTIKDPEPQEAFMCHICIQYIQARRNRAEKRRIQKQKTALKRSGQNADDLAVGSGGESDYHDVAALGHELRDLTELIQDAKGRLRESIGVSKLNETRRSMLV